MRFMVLVKASKDSEAGVLPDEQELVEMGKFNEELVKAGVMLAGEGLQSSAKGKRIKFTPGGKTTITDGPFAETKELLAGFWMVEMKSMDEVVAWFKRCPPSVGEIEIRQVFDSADFEPVIKTDAGRAVLQAEDEFRKRSGKGA
jgi:hypothetical protein